MKFKLSALILGLLAVAACGLAADGKMPGAAAAFLERARMPNQRPTYAMLDGALQHRRRGGDTLSVSLYFGVIITPERTFGQILVDGRESYILGQSRDARQDGTSVMHSPDCELLSKVGVRASDLTMSFLYYDLVQELPETTLSAVVSCRVMLLKSPDGKELVKVYLTKEQAFPVKAEFFHPDSKEPFRSVETGGFTEKDGLYYAGNLRIEGPGWRTRIEFDRDKAQVGFLDKNSPPRIVREAVKKDVPNTNSK